MHNTPFRIELPTEFHELGKITCKEPISIEVYHIDEKTERAYFTWDFGMDGVVHLKNWILEDKKIEGVKERILADVIFDIGHAFFHYEGDPNYTPYHWALAGWLKARVDTHEDIEPPPPSDTPKTKTTPRKQNKDLPSPQK